MPGFPDEEEPRTFIDFINIEVFNTKTGETVPLRVSETDLVREVKLALFVKVGLPLDQQRLRFVQSFGRTELRNHRRLTSYRGLGNGSVLDLSPKACKDLIVLELEPLELL